MRFLCVCVAALSGLLAVRCFVFTPEPTETAVNILRWVLASDREWQAIIGRVMKVASLDFNGMLTELGLRNSSDGGITPQKIIEHLIVHEGSTGRQLMYGVRVLGTALEIQFVKTLAAHSLLAVKYTNDRSSTPWSLRVCMSSIQQSLVVYANKVAYFGHKVDFFWELNRIINTFLKENHTLLEVRDHTTEPTQSQIANFFGNLLNETTVHIDNFELQMNKEEILDILNLEDNISYLNESLHYNLINNINSYDLVNVKTFRLEFGDKVFEITKYTDNSLLKTEETETEKQETT